MIHALVRLRCERGWPQDACDCILATCRVIQQAESFSLGRACSILLHRLNRPPRTIFLQWRGKVSHASVLRRVRCGQDSLLACRLASSRCVHAATSLHWAHSIIARVHLHHRRQIPEMLDTLVGVKYVVVHNGYAYRSLGRHDPHSQKVISERDKFYSVDPPWELCPNTVDARHVCAAYPWATDALVFEDGSACWTKNSEHWPPTASYYLIQNERRFGEGRVGFEDFPDRDHTWNTLYGKPSWWDDRMHGHAMCGWEEACFIADVLLRRRLPC